MSQEAHEGLYEISTSHIKKALEQLVELNKMENYDASQSFESINKIIKPILASLKESTVLNDKSLSEDDPDSVVPYVSELLSKFKIVESIRDFMDSPEKEVYGSKIEILKVQIDDLLRHRQWLVSLAVNNMLEDLQPLLNEESLSLVDMDTTIDNLQKAQDLLSKVVPEETKTTKVKRAEVIFDESETPEIEFQQLYKDVNTQKNSNAMIVKKLHKNTSDALDQVNALKEISMSETQSSEESTEEVTDLDESELSSEEVQEVEFEEDESTSEHEQEVEKSEFVEDESSSEEIISFPEKKHVPNEIIKEKEVVLPSQKIPVGKSKIEVCTVELTMKKNDVRNKFEFEGKKIKNLIPEKLNVLTALENELKRLEETKGPKNNTKHSKMKTATEDYWVKMILLADTPKDLGANLKLILESDAIKMPEDKKLQSKLRTHSFHKLKPRKTKSERKLNKVFKKFTKNKIVKPKPPKK